MGVALTSAVRAASYARSNTLGLAAANRHWPARACDAAYARRAAGSMRHPTRGMGRTCENALRESVRIDAIRRGRIALVAVASRRCVQWGRAFGARLGFGWPRPEREYSPYSVAAQERDGLRAVGACQVVLARVLRADRRRVRPSDVRRTLSNMRTMAAVPLTVTTVAYVAQQRDVGKPNRPWRSPLPVHRCGRIDQGFALACCAAAASDSSVGTSSSAIRSPTDRQTIVRLRCVVCAAASRRGAWPRGSPRCSTRSSCRFGVLSCGLSERAFV